MTFVRNILTANNSFQVGIGFDGDCDRMNPMTKQGFLVPGDQLLALYAQYIIPQNHGCGVVFDIKSSDGLIELLESWQAIPIISQSGHSFIKQSIKRNNAVLGGELSCHFFFNDRYYGYDDGIYAALRLIEIMILTHKPLDLLLTIFPKKISSPEIRIECQSDEIKKNIIADVKAVLLSRDDIKSTTIDGIRAKTSYGWGLARASNTQPVICLRFESESIEGLQRVKTDFYNILRTHFDEKMLKDKIELP
jgi:phosphomannomutase/phosphoglucomutase